MLGPFALFTCCCPCDDKYPRRGGYGRHRGYGGDGGDGNTDALLVGAVGGVLVGEALAGGDGGDWGGDGGDFGGDGGDFGGDFGGD